MTTALKKAPQEGPSLKNKKGASRRCLKKGRRSCKKAFKNAPQGWPRKGEQDGLQEGAPRSA